MCFISSRGGGEEEGGRGEEEAMGRDLRHKSPWWKGSFTLSSFQLFEASHQTGLNSRRDTICPPSTTTSSLHGISPTHPSILPSLPIYLNSVFYLPAATGARPPIHLLTKPLSDRWQEVRGKKTNHTLKLQFLHFLYLLFTISDTCRYAQWSLC